MNLKCYKSVNLGIGRYWGTLAALIDTGLTQSAAVGITHQQMLCICVSYPRSLVQTHKSIDNKKQLERQKWFKSADVEVVEPRD